MRTEELAAEQRFLKDVAQHQISVFRDDGVNRHIAFGKPGTRSLSFELITWPGHLCYTGDMGTYVFKRATDMFEFFRTDANSEYMNSKGLTLGINPRYWGEKLESVDKIDGYKEFDPKRFNEIVGEYLVNFIRDHRHEMSRLERRYLWDAVASDVIGGEYGNTGETAMMAANDFSHHVNDKVGTFNFQDFWEHDVTKYSDRFMWCCYAVTWAVRSYDEACDQLKEMDKPREAMTC